MRIINPCWNSHMCMCYLIVQHYTKKHLKILPSQKQFCIWRAFGERTTQYKRRYFDIKDGEELGLSDEMTSVTHLARPTVPFGRNCIDIKINSSPKWAGWNEFKLLVIGHIIDMNTVQFMIGCQYSYSNFSILQYRCNNEFIGLN